MSRRRVKCKSNNIFNSLISIMHVLANWLNFKEIACVSNDISSHSKLSHWLQSLKQFLCYDIHVTCMCGYREGDKVGLLFLVHCFSLSICGYDFDEDDMTDYFTNCFLTFIRLCSVIPLGTLYTFFEVGIPNFVYG